MRRPFRRTPPAGAAVDPLVVSGLTEVAAGALSGWLYALVITDRDDRQTPYADVVDFAHTINAPLITTDGLGHRKVLRDSAVIEAVVAFAADSGDLEHIA